ncbi:Non-specific serine/threonine protein kinase [Bertholletia excelsa]
MTTRLSSPSVALWTIVAVLLAATCTLPLASSSTLAVAYDSHSATVCGIIAGQPTQRILCYKDGLNFSLTPNISFESISGGFNLLCGLRSGGSSILCWDTATFRPKRIYQHHTKLLTEITVGNSQICAVQASNGMGLCWRFPSPEPGYNFREIASGGGFSCGILKRSNRVTCWGGSDVGAEIEKNFKNLTMLSIAAGESHACGVTTTGKLICKGINSSGQLDVPPHSPFEFSGLALGANHSCAIRRKNGLVICWGGKSKLSEFGSNALKFVSFETIVAGLCFTCGLTTNNLSVICWGPNSPAMIPLPPVIPGPCVQHSCSICGVYPDSDSLCAGAGSICRSCDIELPIPALVPPVTPAGSPPPLEAKKRLLLTFGIVGLMGAFAGIFSICYCLWKGPIRGLLHKKTHINKQPTNGEKISQTENSSWKQLEKAEEFCLAELASATGNFSLVNKIGEGSFGTVYKAQLPNGREVAIKRGETRTRNRPALNNFEEKETAFDSELALLSRLHHKHLVGLLGFCQENGERLLVYEYMRNGSLHHHLHVKNQSNSPLNSWKMRIKVALDTARGLEYLHNYAVPPIIHRDIKSSNILLDENWTAKLSDFGLSQMDLEAHQKQNIENMYDNGGKKLVGTVGYIDPEYYVLNVLTVKSDIYGLGVVVLEILTGKRAVFRDEEGGARGVVEYAGPRISVGELKSVLDGRVVAPAAGEAEAVELVAYTAMHCVSLEGKERPVISDVVVNLERALALCEGVGSGTSSSVAAQ